ncbi:MAG: hypothetical protein U5L06_12565 [Rhodovibrio sp.]|nr:hypothetical protein [Rhodovibrio sp.]
MTRFDPTGAPKRTGAALLAAAMIAGTGFPAAAAGDGAAERADDTAAETRGMSVEEAWANAKQDWRELEAASGDAWGAARKEFQQSWSRLQTLMSESDGAPPPDAPAELEQGGNAE